MAEEARADHKGAATILTIIDTFLKDKSSLIDANAYIQSYLLENIDFLLVGHNQPRDTSSTWYSFSAATMLTVLFKENAIKWEGDQIEVEDALKGIQAMAQVGYELIKLYKDKDATSKDIEMFVLKYQKMANESDGFKKYMGTIRKLNMELKS
jgi:hypothetical protein